MNSDLVGYVLVIPSIDELRPAETAVDWEWSSARWYAGEEDVPLQMDRQNVTNHGRMRVYTKFATPILALRSSLSVPHNAVNRFGFV
ncbi:hypothetical protein [Thalassoglobus polymorphus]|uniref:hypothetical protein n=1 Tax=Thalassoglobus polymorphus TaxID=2527994 RepID=UPI0011A49B79|nr:hypothetical protein [Thalassoglobus polymorphus]